MYIYICIYILVCNIYIYIYMYSFPPPWMPRGELALRKGWSALLELARFVWETREAFRRPGEAPGGRALKTREDGMKREFWGGPRREAREPQELPGGPLWQTESTAEALGVAGEVGGDPHRNASSRILRRAAPGGPWRAGGALRWGPVGRCGIKAMRFEALGVASFTCFPRAPRG